MSRRCLRGLASLCFAVSIASPTWAQAEAAQDAEMRAKIQAEREAAALQKQQGEAACYQRFAVEDCLQKVQRAHRQQESRLRKQEVQLNEVRRQAREAERQRALATSQAEAAKQPPPAVQSQVRKACVTPDCHAALRDREQQAQDRALAHQRRLQAREAELRTLQLDRARQATEARDRQVRLQSEVQAERDRQTKAQAETAAKGRKRAAPLPAVPATVAPSSP